MIKAGESIRENEPLVEVSTDKVTLEIASPATGVLREMLHIEGDKVEPGELLGRIDTAFAETPPVKADVAPEGLAPAVRKLLKEHNLDAAAIPVTGRGGRLSHQDVLDFIAARGKKTNSHLVPHTPMRRAIAANMTRSVQTAPHVTAVFEADMTQVLADREARKRAGGELPSITAYLLRAMIQAAKAVPEVNSRWRDDALEVFDEVNLGVGTALPDGGLVAPVIHGAQALSFDDLATKLRDLTARARAGKLTREDMEGGTFTISNHGTGGSLLAAPIVLPPGQAAIVGAGKLQQRVTVSENGQFEARRMMYVTLTVDHRVLDGQQTNAFLTKFVVALAEGQ
jgi:2-oxoglutarate dehydrogenase E2 component (dihydrolipoamide succinyltransferase)